MSTHCSPTQRGIPVAATYPVTKGGAGAGPALRELVGDADLVAGLQDLGRECGVSEADSLARRIENVLYQGRLPAFEYRVVRPGSSSPPGTTMAARLS